MKIPESDIPKIILRIENGDKVVDIAKEYGVHRVSMFKRLREYKARFAENNEKIKFKKD